MKKSIPRPRQVLLILVIVLTGSSFFPIDWARAISHHPRHLVSALARPVTYPVKLLADSIRRPVDLDIHQIEESLLRERYEMALQNIRRLEQQLMEAREQINTLGQVRQHLGLSGVRLYPASVIAWSNDPVHPTLQINRGTRHGLRIGLVVASGFNLVGRISDAGPVTSTVRLITGTQTQLTVRILPPVPDAPPHQLIVQLKSSDDQDGFTALTDVNDPVQIGDLAHLSDDLWPPEGGGLVVGKVVSIDNDPDDPILRRHTRIVPIRSLPHLDRVVVLVPSDGRLMIEDDPTITRESVRER